MGISSLARSIADSPTLRLNEEARQLRERGEPVLHLGIGEPGNPAPPAAIRGATARLARGDVKYAPTDGLPSLKQAIVRYTEANYGRRVSPANVIVSAGAKQALYNLLFAILDPQDEVVLLAPHWVSYPEMVRMVRGVPVVVAPPPGGFLPRLEDIERAVTPATRAIIVNSPNNPSGAVYPAELIESLVRLAERRGLYLVADDIYHRLVFDGREAAPAWRFATGEPDGSRIVVINGVSKLYGMTGFRIGWAVASRELVGVMSNVQSQTTTCCSPVMQAGAEAALDGDQDVIEDLRRTMQENRDVMLAELALLPGVRTVKPGGTFYCLPDFSAYRRDSIELSRFLLEQALVVTVPGREFGMEGHLRLSYTGSAAEIREAIARIRWALDPCTPAEIRVGSKTRVRDWT
ncbi:MAG: pyridoxal phosphate-dependent aminotransferase [Candidatus Eisenbacteria bacterium]|nr:pyridoxal phosphate-dependent aminotransferase [Candidatus Eisenbacteria bacterium]